ncbi:hypothetical protein [Nostoc sp. ATCC 53789]|uniref:hypothetical protein n=1 Tax=Nostoc sp. ATCC 53789 TaxID=76335 RepID=UPI00132E7472|nr:hypothetical protein [Nostoc sp. ATCC 53789]QHG21082.1 hypothetical protein GJB62_35115 [Nostoc sp. ATCC 53789]
MNCSQVLPPCDRYVITRAIAPAGRSPSRPHSGRITLLIVELFYLSLVSLC